MTARERLPNKRLSETFEFEVFGLHYMATVSRFSEKKPRVLSVRIASRCPG